MIQRGDVIPLKDDLWLNRQRFAGGVVAKVHKEIYAMIKGKSANLSLIHIGDLARDIITSNNCTPTFLNYNGFPGVICSSLNEEIVHGYPRDIVLKEGDVLKIDVGATFEGAIGDCAVTYLYGKPKSDKVFLLLKSCQEALNIAISMVKVGNKIGQIGSAIYQKSRDDGFGVIDKYGGHGINYNKLHAFPFVPNKSKSDDGVTIQPGLSIAIEPMFVIGSNTNTKTLKDGWTIITKDIGAHFEHSVTLDKDGKLHIITDHGIDVNDYI